jgi:hypothetical protein
MKTMAYDIGPLSLETLIGPVARATEALARLDERLSRSPVRNGFVERQDFADAAAALWLEGGLVHLEDLVLHDAHMDVRTPTHELTRAHAVLRARRQVFAQAPDWALGHAGLRELTGRGRQAAEAGVGRVGQGAATHADEAEIWDDAEDDVLAEEFAEIDAVLARSSKILSGAYAPAKTPRSEERPDLIYDLDWDEDARLAEWQVVMVRTRDLPVVLRGAILLEAWSDIEVLQHGHLGRAAADRRAAAAGGSRPSSSRLPAPRRQEHSARAEAVAQSRQSPAGRRRRNPRSGTG